MRERPQCRACARRARPADPFCSEECRRAFIHDRERITRIESVELQHDHRGALWHNGRRLNLQNSA